MRSSVIHVARNLKTNTFEAATKVLDALWTNCLDVRWLSCVRRFTSSRVDVRELLCGCMNGAMRMPRHSHCSDAVHAVPTTELYIMSEKIQLTERGDINVLDLAIILDLPHEFCVALRAASEQHVELLRSVGMCTLSPPRLLQLVLRAFGRGFVITDDDAADNCMVKDLFGTRLFCCATNCVIVAHWLHIPHGEAESLVITTRMLGSRYNVLCIADACGSKLCKRKVATGFVHDVIHTHFSTTPPKMEWPDNGASIRSYYIHSTFTPARAFYVPRVIFCQRSVVCPSAVFLTRLSEFSR